MRLGLLTTKITRGMIMEWIKIDGAQDIPHDTEVLLWDGCDYSIDYVECNPDDCTEYFANGTEGATHYKDLTPPKE
jgi:hypothetical protein